MTAEYTFFSNSQRTYAKNNPYPGPKKQTSTNLEEFKLCSFSDHNEIKLEMSNRKITKNFPYTWKLNKSPK